MSAGRSAHRPVPRGELEARARLEALFASFDRLTPFELERAGLQRRDVETRRSLLHAVAEAARAADRTVLLADAVARARETVLRRYREGGLHPTWVGLNWGISQGTIEDRVAIVEALEDAAAAAVVEDLLDPEVAHALALDGSRIVGMAAGEVSEGSFSRVTTPPARGLRDTRWRWAGVALGAAVVGSTAFGFAASAAGIGGGIAAAIVAGGIVVALARPDPADAGVEPGADGRGAA